MSHHPSPLLSCLVCAPSHRACDQLVKANSIEGSKQSNVRIVYTPWANLHKTDGMATGSIGFHSAKARRFSRVEHRCNAIVNRLTKTKVERVVDHAAERTAYDARALALRKEATRVAREKASHAAETAEGVADEWRREVAASRALYDVPVALDDRDANEWWREDEDFTPPAPNGGDDSDECAVIVGDDDGFLADDGNGGGDDDEGTPAAAYLAAEEEEEEEEEEEKDASPDVAWLQERGCVGGGATERWSGVADGGRAPCATDRAPSPIAPSHRYTRAEAARALELEGASELHQTRVPGVSDGAPSEGAITSCERALAALFEEHFARAALAVVGGGGAGAQDADEAAGERRDEREARRRRPRWSEREGGIERARMTTRCKRFAQTRRNESSQRVVFALTRAENPCFGVSLIRRGAPRHHPSAACPWPRPSSCCLARHLRRSSRLKS